MINEEVVIKVRTDTKGVSDDVQKAEKSTDQFADKLRQVDKVVNSGELSFKQLSKQIKEYQSIALMAGRESVIGREAIQKAADLKDRLGDLSAEVNRLSQDGQKLQGALQLGSTVMGGYTAFQGVTAMLGVENENLIKTLTKLQAAQSVLMGIEQIRAALEKESALRLQASIVLDKLKAASTSMLAAATGTATGMMKAFRLALMATGIGAIIVGLGMLVANFEKVSDWVKKAIDKLREFKTALMFIMPIIYLLIQGYDLMMTALQKMGIVQSEETKKNIKNAEARIEALKKEEKIIGEKYDFEIAKAKAAGKNTFELEEQKRKALIDNIKMQVEAMLVLVKATGEFTDEQKERLKELSEAAVKLTREGVVARIGEEKRLTDEAKKQSEERSKLAKESEKKKQEALKKEQDLADEQFRMLQELTLSAFDLEIQQLVWQYEKKYELAKGNAELEKALAEQQGKDISAITQKYADEQLENEYQQALRMRDLRLEIKELNEGALSEDATAEEVAAYYENRRQIENEAFANKQQDLRDKAMNEQMSAEELALNLEKLDSEHKNRLIANDEALAEAQKKIEEGKAATVKANMDMTANVLSQFSAIAGKETAEGKALAVAAATINTYRGVSDALAATTVTPFETGLKFANAAAIGIAGFQNVQKILSVQVPKSGGGGGSVSPPRFNNATPTQGREGTATEETNLKEKDKGAKVYILDSEIQSSNKRNSDNDNFATIF